MNMIIIYLVSFIVSIIPYIIYLTTDKLNYIGYDTLLLIKLSFVLSIVPVGNTVVSFFILVVCAISALSVLEEKIKG